MYYVDVIYFFFAGVFFVAGFLVAGFFAAGFFGALAVFVGDEVTAG